MVTYEDHPRTRIVPASPAGLRPAAREAVAEPLSLRGVVTLLRRRSLPIAACAVLSALAAFAAGKTITPRYVAGAQIYIDPRELRLVEKELTPSGQDSLGLQAIVESQAQVITSSNVLGRVVARLDLARDPEFVPPPGTGLLARLGLSKPAAAVSASQTALEELGKRVGVRRTGRTFIVDVTAFSREPEKAARLANAVVDSYLADEAGTRAEAANRASAGLSARLVELREDVNRAESRVQAYKAENGLVGTRDVLVSDQQLTQLNAQLAAARARVAEARARFDQAQRLQSAGPDGTAATDETLSSQAIIGLRAQYAELARKQAELTQDLGRRHPMVSSINAQMQSSRRLIAQETARVVQAAKTDLARAEATMAALGSSFDQAKGRTVDLAHASIRLRELEREVEASRAVYEAFLVRARETGQQARLDLGNARVITPATEPTTSTYPPPARLLAMVGLLAGLVLGIAFVLAQDWLRRDARLHPTGHGTLEAIVAARHRPAPMRKTASREPVAVGGLL